jgi:hypothetical protein
MGSFPNITILVQNGLQLPHPLGEDIKAPLRAKTWTSLLVQGYVVDIWQASLSLLSS